MYYFQLHVRKNLVGKITFTEQFFSTMKLYNWVLRFSILIAIKLAFFRSSSSIFSIRSGCLTHNWQNTILMQYLFQTIRRTNYWDRISTALLKSNCRTLLEPLLLIPRTLTLTKIFKCSNFLNILSKSMFVQ